ncbi:tRNA (5-methylaminomethyl-2-thiouridine)(34)-methyltransferase MnmD [Sulfitobacter sp. D35]|uniref:tRNA (5-methylaminomethyl-2-thiouridine)(34)-methyltransferase MnmD n=1 Tax=Sulfitobacter sp. D35 TaxID=3083252 RepID=UPI00296F060F|nr:tRNA (5-methylaminomethyl-2-thiouridine)(34)-methyltransferase MnmD [Sulfitobacter sp. D35]MDW4500143.1 tRNA (5-methylaminomethyl-2-thiouridine)(34)-methyltransferase MnmD [Sulfitobacter sp. D35]
MPNQTADVAWKDSGVPVSERFDDPYFSLENGLAETRHVFLNGNGLPGRLRGGFRIAELGFGTGLNCLTTLLAWRGAGAPGRLTYTSFEAFPMHGRDMDRALSAFPEMAKVAPALLRVWTPDTGRYELGDGMVLELLVGDARKTLPSWEGVADAWYLDGFAPAKNPELWSPELMAEVARHTAPGGTCATYTAAGAVRRGLEAAGFDITRAPGYGRKRHMTRGVLPE